MDEAMHHIPENAMHCLTRHFLHITAALTLLGAAACQSTPAAKPATNSYAFQPPITLDVATINVIDEYQSPGKSPNVEHLFPTPPAQAVHQWTKDRLKAAGTSRVAEVVIKDASVIETALPRTEGVKGWFTKDQSERYDGKLAVEIKIYGERRVLPEAEVSAQATRSRTVAEDASVAAREALFDTLSQELAEELNQELEKQMRTYFGNYITAK